MTLLSFLEPAAVAGALDGQAAYHVPTGAPEVVGALELAIHTTIYQEMRWLEDQVLRLEQALAALTQTPTASESGQHAANALLEEAIAACRSRLMGVAVTAGALAQQPDVAAGCSG
ncbi:MAG: hypothetical protein AVDCRST_MAG77-4693 [uncultured Chloroflexi bacterium]|uniref:Uncharacterized protein n=1 Tax=uncultured Chloroflexota bacterium TaxID=166587 RepID=A0A6J4JYF3_9CHLR|nr:MAG: hypothetical protein AVDCRST_MAG77-4693 [uncultured Chloroflexota bacterium]